MVELAAGFLFFWNRVLEFDLVLGWECAYV